MASQLSQYMAEIGTCRRMAATPWAFLGLAGRTEEFHLNNFLGRRASISAGKAEKHRIRIGKQHRDLWLRPGTGDWFIFHEVFTNKCYRIPKTILPKAKTIVDLGANIGMTTIFLAQLFPDARYICVEPSPLNTELLRRNVAWLGDRVSVIESAVADYCGDIAFADSDWSWGGHIEKGHAVSRTVTCSTVMSLLKSQQAGFVDLLKVDVEGAEELIFSGSPDWLRSVGCIIVELHGGYSFSQFEKDVRPFGFAAVFEGSPAGDGMITAVSHRLTAAGVDQPLKAISRLT